MPPPSPSLTLTGARQAILRSVYVAVFAASLTGLVMCVLPGRETVYAISGPELEPAGGPMLALAMIAATMLAAIGLALPRREVTVLAAGTFTVLAIPMAVWAAIGQLDPPGENTHALWPAHVLAHALPVVAFAGPALATVGLVLFRLEARATIAPIPVATLR